MMTGSAWPNDQRAATEVPRNSGHPLASRGDGYGRVLLDEAVVGLRRSGRTREVAPWPTSELDPEVTALAC